MTPSMEIVYWGNEDIVTVSYLTTPNQSVGGGEDGDNYEFQKIVQKGAGNENDKK